VSRATARRMKYSDEFVVANQVLCCDDLLGKGSLELYGTMGSGVTTLLQYTRHLEVRVLPRERFTTT
jgi:hypothetical protein